jgi:hypothetical protein
MRCGGVTATLRLSACLGLALAMLLPGSGCSKAAKKKPKAAAAARPSDQDALDEAADEPAAEAVAEHLAPRRSAAKRSRIGGLQPYPTRLAGQANDV